MQDGFVLDQVAVATGQPIRPTLLSTGERDHGTNRITFANRPNQLYRLILPILFFLSQFLLVEQVIEKETERLIERQKD